MTADGAYNCCVRLFIATVQASPWPRPDAIATWVEPLATDPHLEETVVPGEDGRRHVVVSGLDAPCVESRLRAMIEHDAVVLVELVIPTGPERAMLVGREVVKALAENYGQPVEVAGEEDSGSFWWQLPSLDLELLVYGNNSPAPHGVVASLKRSERPRWRLL